MTAETPERNLAEAIRERDSAYKKRDEAVALGIELQREALGTRRERIATAVMAGFAAAPDAPSTLENLVSAAVRWADALIAELDKREDKT